MESLAIRPHFERQDLESSRHKLALELARPGRILLIIRGNSPEAEEFSRRAKDLVDSCDWKKSLWIRDSRIMGSKREKVWFGEDYRACAVVLGFDKEPVGVLYPDSSSYDLSVLLAAALKSQYGSTSKGRQTH